MFRPNQVTLILSAAAALVACITAPITPSYAQSTPSRKVWTVTEILDQRTFTPIVKKPRYRASAPFKPCVVPQHVPSIVQYRPAVAECENRAAIILSGKYKDVFSVVVRDRENKDRWPPEGINGCTAYERDVLALHKCSAFKAHQVLDIEDDRGDASVHCLGASGYSKLFTRVTRMTAKLADVPNSTNDPLVRWCLRGPTVPLN